MEFIIELILELILEGTIEISSNKKVPKWIRYPLIFVLILLLSLVIILFFILGISLYKENIVVSIFLITIGIIFLISGVVKFKNLYLEKKEEIPEKRGAQ